MIERARTGLLERDFERESKDIQRLAALNFDRSYGFRNFFKPLESSAKKQVYLALARYSLGVLDSAGFLQTIEMFMRVRVSKNFLRVLGEFIKACHPPDYPLNLQYDIQIRYEILQNYVLEYEEE